MIYRANNALSLNNRKGAAQEINFSNLAESLMSKPHKCVINPQTRFVTLK